MNFKKLTVTLATGLTLAANLLAPGAVLAADTVKIGGNFEQTGGAAAYGSPMAEGLQLAVEQKNAAGGVLDGKQLEALIIDNKTEKTEVASVATKLLTEGVVGVVGPATTGDALASIPVMTRGGVPAIFPATTGNGVTLDSAGKVLEYIFRVCFEDSYQGVVAAQYAAKNLNAKKVAILTDKGNDYSQGLTDSFKAEFEKQGGTVVVNEAYASGDTDFQAVLTTLRGQEFDVLYLPGYYTEAGLIIKQARELGLTQPVLGGDGLHSDTLKELAGAENLTDVYFTTHFSEKSEDEHVQAFIKAYEAKFNKKPDTFAALGYDASNLLIQAIETAKSTDPAAVTKAIAETKDFKGVTGTFTINENHDPVKSVVLLHLENGEIKSAENITAE